MTNLNNKVVLLTGAGKGIGKGIMLNCLENGAYVYAITRSPVNKLTIKSLSKYKNKYQLFFSDVNNLKSIEKIFLKSIRDNNFINCLINNAGIRQRKKFENISKKELLEVFNTNFFSIFQITQLFIKYLNKNITHLAYTDTQIKLLDKIFKKKAIFTNHPIIENKKNINYIKKKFKKKIILIPTRHHFIKDLIENFIKKNLNYQFYVLAKKNNLKKKIFSNFNNVKLIEFIKEKDINKVIAIYLPLDPEIYKYRVSAWLYMGIAYNKKILMENNDLYKFEKKRFPNYIVLNNNKIFNNFNSFVKKKINISKYNSLLITNLKKSIFGKIKIDN